MDDFAFSRPEWHKHAACRGMMVDPDKPNFFIPRGDQVGMLKKVRKVCEGCPVIDDCLEFAIRMDIEQGVWGGKSARERKAIRRQRGLGRGEDTWRIDLGVATSRAAADRELLDRLD